MNRYGHRRYGRGAKKDLVPITNIRDPQGKHSRLTNSDKADRCCFVAPESQDFAQHTDKHPQDQYTTMLQDQFGFDPFAEDKLSTQQKELKKVLCESSPKVENSSQCLDPNEPVITVPACVATEKWQEVDNVNDIAKYIVETDNDNEIPAKPTVSPVSSVHNIHISETPNVKVIAEKFSKYKKNNIELRKLDEKVVCVEYEIYDEANMDKPIQMMRAFFSIKPTFENSYEGQSAEPSLAELKHKLNLTDEELNELSQKEIEIIDGQISENKSYLDDLRRVLRRKQTIYAKKNKSSLDLKSLYEMAKSERPTLESEISETNFLSKAELQEMKDLILKRCESSVRGINRRKVKSQNGETNGKREFGIISNSIINELFRESGIVK